MVRDHQYVRSPIQGRRKKREKIEQILEKIRKSDLLAPGDRIVVGLSGGADSVFLLYCLVALRKALLLTLTGAHYNHGLRGEASERDEQFVEGLCKRWRIPFMKGRWDRDGRASSEERAREARYAFFEKCCRESGAQAVALAHTLDDDVETILFRLLRGSGLLGLKGIPEERPLGPYRLIRPLKGIGREAIRSFLREKKIPWCEDTSNQDLRYTRNRIRHTLLPLLEKEFNPNIRRILVHLSKNIAEDYDFLRNEGESAFQNALFKQGNRQVILKRRTFQTFPVAVQKQLFRKVLRLLGTDMDEVGYADWEAVAASLQGKSFCRTLPGSLELRGTPTKLFFTVPQKGNCKRSLVFPEKI